MIGRVLEAMLFATVWGLLVSIPYMVWDGLGVQNRHVYDCGLLVFGAVVVYPALRLAKGLKERADQDAGDLARHHNGQ